VDRLVDVFREVRRVLRDDGTLWLNLGDSYSGGTIGRADAERNGVDGFTGGQKFKGEKFSQRAVPDGLKPKDLVGIPWRVAFALQEAGWWLRSDIIWAKPAPMPESVTDRPTRSHEYIFLLAKSERYWYDAAAIAERSTYAGKNVSLGEKSLSRGQATGANVSASGNGTAAFVTVTETRNKRDVWTINGDPFPEAHFATFPPALILPCVLAGCPAGGLVLDPFSGAGTTALVAKEQGRRAIGIELNANYVAMTARRLSQDVLFSTLDSDVVIIGARRKSS
jgi:DNA modification methylase